MLRVLLAFLVMAALAALAAWVAGQPGTILIALPGWEVRTSLPAAVAILSATVALVYGAVLLVTWIVRRPAALARWRRIKRQIAGREALSRGLIAAAAGEGAAARKLAQAAQRQLGSSPLGLLLTAQAAQLEGDEKAVERAYLEMLESDDMAFLGVRGLFMQAQRRGDRAAALGYAQRALSLRPQTAWALNATFELQSADGAWAEAGKTLDAAASARLIDSPVRRRRKAVLLAAEALQADGAGDDGVALARAQAALALAPGLAPAAALAGRLLGENGRLWKAADVIETAWTHEPHPDLAAAYASLKPGEPPDMRAKRLLGLAALHRDHRESRMLTAQQAIILRDYATARSALEPIAAPFASARVCALMSDLDLAEHGDSMSARAWTARAARAPRDAEWTCQACQRTAPAWTPVCPQCGAFDTLAWRGEGQIAVERLPEGPRPDPADAVPVPPRAAPALPAPEPDAAPAGPVTPAKTPIMPGVSDALKRWRARLAPPARRAPLAGAAADAAPKAEDIVRAHLPSGFQPDDPGIADDGDREFDAPPRGVFRR